MTAPFQLHLPTGRPLPIVASIPHSGLLVPEAIACTLAEPYRHFLPNQDWHLDKLYDFLPDLGATVLQATHSRYVVDLNRALKEPFFGSFWRSPVPEKTAFDKPLYQNRPAPEEIRQRIGRYYQPYYQQLQQLLDRAIARFGKVYLLDLHSFLGLIDDEICLGNASGQSCSPSWLAIVERAFRDRGYQVVCNKVFTGGNIVRHYGWHPQVEALQIEVRYPTYLQAEELERPIVPNWQVPEFDRAKQKFQQIFRQICQEAFVFAG